MSAKSPIKPNRIESRNLDLNELKLINNKDKIFLFNLPKIKCNEFDILEKHQLNIVYENNKLLNIDIVLGFRWKNKNQLRFYRKELYSNEKIFEVGEWKTKNGFWVGKDGEMQ